MRDAASARSGRMDGKVVMLTGAAQGFGLGIATELIAEGAQVVLADLNIELATQNAAELSARYLGGKARPASVTWSSNQGRRWGSCTSIDGTIRISDRVRGMPAWVLDYVLMHELTHLLHAGHGPEFWATLAVYPRTERARGFLEGVAFAPQSASELDDEAPATDAPGDDVIEVEELDDDVIEPDEPDDSLGR